MSTTARLTPVSTSGFNRAIWNQLSSIDLRIIDELAFLARLTAQRSSTGAKYCFPGRRWLAQRLGCSVETITRHTTKLKQLGMLNKLQRRPVNGQWQTCLYRLVHPMAWAAAGLRAKIQACADRLSKPTVLASPSERRVNDRSSKESLREIIARGLAKFAPD